MYFPDILQVINSWWQIQKASHKSRVWKLTHHLEDNYSYKPTISIDSGSGLDHTKIII
jgi:hypothetical protein